MFAYSYDVEVVYLADADNLSSTTDPFNYCRKLKTIIGNVCAISLSDNSFKETRSLENITIGKLRSNIKLNYSSRLTLDSVIYMVNKATNTTAITITLHATAYARCQADTTEYTYNSNTYTGIIAYATAKNITIQSA